MNEESNKITEAVLQSPFCTNLRSKKYFFLETIPLKKEDYIDLSNHCWCSNTQQVVGPDGGKVRPERCQSNRTCYKSQFV